MKKNRQWKQKVAGLSLAAVLFTSLVPAGAASPVYADPESVSGEGVPEAQEITIDESNTKTAADRSDAGNTGSAEQKTGNNSTAVSGSTDGSDSEDKKSIVITLNADSLNLTVGETRELQAEVTNGSSAGLEWKTASTKVVSVQTNRTDSSKCTISAVGAGSTNVTVSLKSSGETVSAVCRITVNEKLQNLQRDSDGSLRYYKDGKRDTSFTGFAQYEGTWYYVEKGVVTGKKTTVLEGTVNGEKGWWYVHNSRLDRTYDGVEYNSNGWWRIENGKVNFGFTGFARNSHGWWYLEKGKVTFRKTSVIEGTVNGEKGWWYVQNSNVKFINSVEANQNGWWRIENGRVNFNFNGFAHNRNGWWYIRNGKVQFGTTSVVKGKVNGTGEDGWWYVKKGKIQFINSVEPNQNGWWYIDNGKVNFKFNGIAQNYNGLWYIKNGKVDFGYTGNYTYKGTSYRIVKGKAYASAEGAMAVKAQQYDSATGYLILVNKSTHKVGIFTGKKGNWLMKKYYSCATGANGKTPSGSFTIGRRWNYYDSAAGNRCWYCMEFKGHYLFHSVLCKPASHPVVRDGRVGVSISKGCVRLEVPNIKWMYDNVPKNTRVIIY